MHLTTVETSRTAHEVHNMLMLCCRVGEHPSSFFAMGTACDLLWQLGKQGPPEVREPETNEEILCVAAQLVEVPVESRVKMGAIATGMRLSPHPAALERNPLVRHWVHGLLAGQAWLLGLCETAQLEDWIRRPQTCENDWAELGILEDPWSTARGGASL